MRTLSLISVLLLSSATGTFGMGFGGSCGGGGCSSGCCGGGGGGGGGGGAVCPPPLPCPIPAAPAPIACPQFNTGPVPLPAPPPCPPPQVVMIPAPPPPPQIIPVPTCGAGGYGGGGFGGGGFGGGGGCVGGGGGGYSLAQVSCCTGCRCRFSKAKALGTKTSKDEKPTKEAKKVEMEEFENVTSCNSPPLKEIMMAVMTNDDADAAKRNIQRRAHEKFLGKFDVICSTGEFTYVVNTNFYCQVTVGKLSCYAFRQL